MPSKEFAAWYAQPSGAMRNAERCDDCDKPAVVTLTQDGKTVRACERHVASLRA